MLPLLLPRGRPADFNTVQIEGEPEYLENFNDSQHGYLRVTVTKKKIVLDYVAVPDPSENPKDGILKPFDSVEVDF